MGHRGRKPLYAKREAFARLIAEGVPSARACRMVGVCRRTGTRWRNGRRITSGGRVLNLPPVITVSPNPQERYSPRYLSEDERVPPGRPAPRAAHDARDRDGHGPVALDGQPRSAVALIRPADTGRSRPTDGHSGAAASIGPAAWPATRRCVTGSRTSSRRAAARSRSRAACIASFPTSRHAGCAPRRSTRPSTVPTSATCPGSCPGGSSTSDVEDAWRAGMPKPAARARSPA